MNYSDLRLKRNEFVVGAGLAPALESGSGKDVKPRLVSDFSFNEVLGAAIQQNGDLKFSAHALRRLYSRGIRLNDLEILSLLNASAKAADKNCKESLMVSDRVAFIVNLPNRTVVTAMDTGSLKNNIFTNIDSAVIL